MSEPIETATETPAAETAPAQETVETDWKAEARKWESRAKENTAKLKDAEPKLAEYDRLVEASKTDLERKTEEITRWQSEAEKWRTTSVASRIEAMAAVDFADPSDAATALADPAKYLDAGGQVNETAIQADLAALLERKPHWRRQDGQPAPRVPAPNHAQGSGVGGRSAPDPAAEFGAFLTGQLNRS